MTVRADDFEEFASIHYDNERTGQSITIEPRVVKEIILKSNHYLVGLRDLTSELRFPVFESLGQRNISGFIGEVFTGIAEGLLQGFCANPHPDGRPDLLDVSVPAARAAYDAGFVGDGPQETKLPSRASFAPFSYGGIEVKCTIGTPVSNYKKRLKDMGLDAFAVGQPRVDYLRGINYWGHHQHCGNLLGLYYDYAAEQGGAPQIRAVFHSELDSETDWTPLSVGKPKSKKTSNTSLTAKGRRRMLASPIVAVRDPRYRQALIKAGAAFGSLGHQQRLVVGG